MQGAAVGEAHRDHQSDQLARLRRIVEMLRQLPGRDGLLRVDVQVGVQNQLLRRIQHRSLRTAETVSRSLRHYRQRTQLVGGAFRPRLEKLHPSSLLGLDPAKFPEARDPG